jgi:hypothetical protein
MTTHNTTSLNGHDEIMTTHTTHKGLTPNTTSLNGHDVIMTTHNTTSSNGHDVIMTTHNTTSSNGHDVIMKICITAYPLNPHCKVICCLCQHQAYQKPLGQYTAGERYEVYLGNPRPVLKNAECICV